MKPFILMLITILCFVIGNAQTIQSNSINTVHLRDGAVTESKIGSGQVVKSINFLKDDIKLQEGENVKITSTGNTIIISSTAGDHIFSNKSGNVGIGIANPDSKLHIGGDVHLQEPAGIFFNGGPSDPNYFLKPYSASNEWGMRLNGFSGVRLSTGQGDILNVFQDKVGIGTLSPNARLHVSGGPALLDNNQFLQFKDETGAIRNILGILTDGTVELKGYHGTPMIKGVNGNTYVYGSGNDIGGTLGLTIATNGNVGIGTTTPTASLDVQGSVKAQNAHIEGAAYLGESAPGIKMKKITGIYNYFAPIEALNPLINHGNEVIRFPLGVSLEKILSISILIDNRYPPNYGARGFEYNYWLRDISAEPQITEPEIWITRNASELNGDPIKILIIYEE